MGGNISLEERTIDLSVEVKELLVGRQLLRRWNRNAELPIRLAVQLVSANEACSRRVGRAQEDEVGRYALILLEQDEVADAYRGGRDGARGRKVAFEQRM